MAIRKPNGSNQQQTIHKGAEVLWNKKSQPSKQNNYEKQDRKSFSDEHKSAGHHPNYWEHNHELYWEISFRDNP